MVPADAAFFSGSLRLKDQYEMVRNSNAMQAILSLPAVQMGLGQAEDMQSMPGSPLSMAATFLELPENQQALELLTDMVSTDTFVYGERSCVQFAKLLIALQRANQWQASRRLSVMNSATMNHSTPTTPQPVCSLRRSLRTLMISSCPILCGASRHPRTMPPRSSLPVWK